MIRIYYIIFQTMKDNKKEDMLPLHIYDNFKATKQKFKILSAHKKTLGNDYAIYEVADYELFKILKQTDD